MVRYKDYELCKKCASGQKNVAGKKCQACIDNHLFEPKKQNVNRLKRR